MLQELTSNRYSYSVLITQDDTLVNDDNGFFLFVVRRLPWALGFPIPL